MKKKDKKRERMKKKRIGKKREKVRVVWYVGVVVSPWSELVPGDAHFFPPHSHLSQNQEYHISPLPPLK